MPYDGPPACLRPVVAQVRRVRMLHFWEGMRRLPASAILLALVVLSGCRRATEVASRYNSAGDIGDTTLHFGRLDTTLLTNGSGWVRRQPGVMPDLGPPQQLQAPAGVDSAFAPADTAPPPSGTDSSAVRPRSRRDSTPDTLTSAPDSRPSRQRRDSVRPDQRPARPDTSPDTSMSDSTR